MKNIEKHLKTKNWFNYHDFYKKISKKENFKVFVEIGVWKGHSIIYLSNLLRDKDVEVYAIDLFNETYKYKKTEEIKYLYDIFKENVKIANLSDKITPIKSISWEASEKFDDDSVDFVFIDADHEYDSVIKDINSWLPKIKKGGIISGHDYFNPCGVKKAVDEIFGDKTKFDGPCWFVEVD